MDYSCDWIIEAQLDSEINNKIKNSIFGVIENKKIQSDTRGTSCRGNIKQYNLLEHIDSELLEFIKQITKEQLFQNQIIDSLSYKLIETTIWTCIGQKGSYHIMHNHSLRHGNFRDLVSTILYLETPDIAGTDGLFYSFFRTNEIMVKPPKNGKVLIFPVWLFHGTYPQPEGNRQTLNFTFEILKD